MGASISQSVFHQCHAANKTCSRCYFQGVTERSYRLFVCQDLKWSFSFLSWHNEQVITRATLLELVHFKSCFPKQLKLGSPLNHLYNHSLEFLQLFVLYFNFSCWWNLEIQGSSQFLFLKSPDHPFPDGGSFIVALISCTRVALLQFRHRFFNRRKHLVAVEAAQPLSSNKALTRLSNSFRMCLLPNTMRESPVKVFCTQWNVIIRDMVNLVELFDPNGLAKIIIICSYYHVKRNIAKNRNRNVTNNIGIYGLTDLLNEYFSETFIYWVLIIIQSVTQTG